MILEYNFNYDMFLVFLSCFGCSLHIGIPATNAILCCVSVLLSMTCNRLLVEAKQETEVVESANLMSCGVILLVLGLAAMTQSKEIGS